MACDVWRAKIEAYVDAELPAEEMKAFDVHLRACPSCAADALRRVQWKRATQLAGKRYSPSGEFRQRVAQMVSARKRPRRWEVWLPGLAVAAALVLVVFLAGNRWWSFQREKTFGELADLHVAALASSSPVDVVSSDRHAVKPWFAGKLPFTFNLPELENSSFALLGGRVTYLDQAPGAHLLYQVRQHRISVFVFQDRPAVGRWLVAGDSLTRQMSFTVETWSEGGLRYFVIGDTGREDIHRLGELMKNAARS